MRPESNPTARRVPECSLPRQLGVGHQVTLTARSHLVEAYLAVGRAAESFASYRMLVTDAERILSASHPVTLAARENLAAAYRSD
jgi:hypothetical protein